MSPLHANGTEWEGAEVEDGVAIARAEQRKADKYPELVNSDQVRLVTLAGEVGGRWSAATATFLRLLARSKAAGATPHLQQSVQMALEQRWWALLAGATQDSLAAELPQLSFLLGHPCPNASSGYGAHDLLFPRPSPGKHSCTHSRCRL